MKKYVYFLLIACILVPSISIADNVVLPYTFQSGTPAKAAEVNANFETLKNAVDNGLNDIANIKPVLGMNDEILLPLGNRYSVIRYVTTGADSYDINNSAIIRSFDGVRFSLDSGEAVFVSGTVKIESSIAVSLPVNLPIVFSGDGNKGIIQNTHNGGNSWGTTCVIVRNGNFILFNDSAGRVVAVSGDLRINKY